MNLGDTAGGHGSGLDPDLVDTLFDRHVSSGRAARPGRRFGLGLALVNDVVTAHYGRIAAENIPAGGAAFTLELPACSG